MVVVSSMLILGGLVACPHQKKKLKIRCQEIEFGGIFDGLAVNQIIVLLMLSRVNNREESIQLPYTISKMILLSLSVYFSKI